MLSVFAAWEQKVHLQSHILEGFSIDMHMNYNSTHLNFSKPYVVV